jgi:hypothetical protein
MILKTKFGIFLDPVSGIMFDSGMYYCWDLLFGYSSAVEVGDGRLRLRPG